MSEELKTPLSIGRGYITPTIVDKGGAYIAGVYSPFTEEAAAIVHRVNCHETLVEALRNALQHLEIYAERCENEWGLGRDIEQMDADGDLPCIIVSTRAALELAEGGGHE